MARNHHSGKKGFAIGALFGGLIGGVTALLFAPKSGDKLRKDLSKRCQSVSDKTCELFDGVCEKTCELVDKAKEIACCAKDAASKVCRRERD